MSFIDGFTELSPMDELLEKHFPDVQYTTNWIQKHHSDELSIGHDFTDLENILSQTRLDLDFEASSPVSSHASSSEPRSPQIFQDSNESIADDVLANLPIRLLNKRIQNLPKDEIKKIRKRRRSLKNRGYATSCRQRRVALKDDLEIQNNCLKAQLRKTKENLSVAVKDRNAYKIKYEQLYGLLMTVPCTTMASS